MRLICTTPNNDWRRVSLGHDPCRPSGDRPLNFLHAPVMSHDSTEGGLVLGGVSAGYGETVVVGAA